MAASADAAIHRSLRLGLVLLQKQSRDQEPEARVRSKESRPGPPRPGRQDGDRAGQKMKKIHDVVGCAPPRRPGFAQGGIPGRERGTHRMPRPD